MWKKIKTILQTLGVVLFVTVVLLFVLRLSNFIFVCEIKAFQHTLTEQRELGNEVEQTAMTDRVIELNTEIARQKVLANLPVFKHFFIQEFRDIPIVK